MNSPSLPPTTEPPSALVELTQEALTEPPSSAAPPLTSGPKAETKIDK